MHVGQSKVATGVVEGKAAVVQTHQMQDRGVEVVNVNRVMDDVVGKLSVSP